MGPRQTIPPPDGYADACWVIETIAQGLARRAGANPDVALMLSELARQSCDQRFFREPFARRVAACVLLPETVGATLAHDSGLAAALAAVEDRLCWRPEDEIYADPGFATADLIGGLQGFFPGYDFRLGLLLLAPGRSYPRHHHIQPEIFWLLSGPAEVITGEAGSLRRQVHDAGTVICHGREDTHGFSSLGSPLLAVWCWTRDTAQAVWLAADRGDAP